MFNTPTNVLIQTQQVIAPDKVYTPEQAVTPEQETDTGMKLKDNLSRLRNRVKTLLKKPQPVQRSPEWFANRNTLVTASEAASCLTTSKKVCERYANLYDISNFKYNDTKSANSYEKMNDYILKKCKAFYGEKVFFDSVYTLWGKKYEQIAVNLYKRKNNTDVYDFGLLKHPYLKWLGASPDGITPDGVMLEIKCPYSRKIKPNYVPFHYYIQVQIQLEVALLETADFMECEIKELDTLAEYCGVLSGVSPPRDDATAGLSPPHDDESAASSKTSKSSSPSLTSCPTHVVDPTISSRGGETPLWNPAGVIVNLVEEPDNSESKYIYQDAFDDTDPLIWAKSITDTLESDTYKLIYYHIPNYSIVTIKRDQVWFNSVKEDIKKVHEKITFYQNNKDEFLKFVEECRMEKNKKHIDAFNSSVCLL